MIAMKRLYGSYNVMLIFTLKKAPLVLLYFMIDKLERSNMEEQILCGIQLRN